LRNSRQVRILVLALFIVGCPPAFAPVDWKVHAAPDFGAGDVWLDQGMPAPHHISGFRGHVVLIDFWEFTCINCIRDFAILKRWYTKYRPYGFEVVGVHFGEFAIGFKVDNVRTAAQRFRLPWPIVADQNGETWKAYAANGWPNRYLLNPQGEIVMKVEGERNNLEMETKIRELLAVAHPEVMNVSLDADEDGFKAECGTPTQETFLGELYGRSAVDDIAGHHTGDEADFLPPHSPPDGGVMLAGRWRIEHDGVTSEGHGASAEIRYHARSLYAVLDAPAGKKVRIDLFEDGSPLPKDNSGADVQFDSKGAYMEVDGAHMYYIVRSPNFSAHLLGLQSEGSGVILHSFSYGNNCQLEDRP
jgi:thiol-disulfide isomerase/thioredoxin